MNLVQANVYKVDNAVELSKYTTYELSELRTNSDGIKKLNLQLSNAVINKNNFDFEEYNRRFKPMYPATEPFFAVVLPNDLADILKDYGVKVLTDYDKITKHVLNYMYVKVTYFDRNGKLKEGNLKPSIRLFDEETKTQMDIDENTIKRLDRTKLACIDLNIGISGSRWKSNAMTSYLHNMDAWEMTSSYGTPYRNARYDNFNGDTAAFDNVYDD